MQRLNPIDAIAPAFTRTHQTLFQPFKAGRTWKLCASSYLAFAGSMFFPVPLAFAALPWHASSSRPALLAYLALATVFTLIFLAFFYLGARMELVHFEMVVTRGKFIAPMWRRYSRTIWPWLGLKVGIGIVLTAVMAPILLTTGRRLFTGIASMPKATPGQPPDPALFHAFMAQMIGFYAMFFLVFFVLKLFATLLNDFVLPFYTLEQLPLLAALSRGVDVIAADPVQIILYLLMKFALSIIGFVMQYFANLIIFVPFGIIIFIGAMIAGITGAHKGSPAYILLIVGGILLYILFIALTMYWSIGTFGYLLTLLEAYGIYFLGGRYPMLGDILEPPAPPAYTFTPPPTPPSPGEDDGPSLPMDPALA
ncbi:DUF7544 domain-containing protein [Granulicella tundricola]|uniref:Transmembrane protein n=1 Tax=Granulicella tundricola (strain ATCC BAA-1859 / DSM 23138 / MP5ACTX9) TaxID=1198114 RepID=E8X149_GRATM|nr:hypothetical protein [Granulicella tundricola]ADW67915.1 hypothetical protein AciX9_0847 [Granulicella tundricola MP5ACTX9]